MGVTFPHTALAAARISSTPMRSTTPAPRHVFRTQTPVPTQEPTSTMTTRHLTPQPGDYAKVNVLGEWYVGKVTVVNEDETLAVVELTNLPKNVPRPPTQLVATMTFPTAAIRPADGDYYSDTRSQDHR